MKKVNILDYNSKDANSEFRYKGTYLHGKLEIEIGYDIFCFDKQEEFSVGATEVIISHTGKIATFFLWRGYTGISEWHGLLVYNDDKEYYLDAKESFDSRTDCI